MSSCDDAQGGTRTHNPLREADFESAAYTVPPLRPDWKKNARDGPKVKAPASTLRCRGAAPDHRPNLLPESIAHDLPLCLLHRRENWTEIAQLFVVDRGEIGPGLFQRAEEPRCAVLIRCATEAELVAERQLQPVLVQFERRTLLGIERDDPLELWKLCRSQSNPVPGLTHQLLMNLQHQRLALARLRRGRRGLLLAEWRGLLPALRRDRSRQQN